MKRLITLLCLFAICAPAWAQGPQGERVKRDGPRSEKMRGQGGPGGPGAMVHRWMEKLKQDNPAEFERLNQLRQEDPLAFRQAMMTKLQKERGKHMPKMDRQDKRGGHADKSFKKGDHGDKSFKGGAKRPRHHGPNPEVIAQAQKVKAAQSDSERQAAISELKDMIRENMAQRREEHLKKISQIETALEHLKGELERNDEKQDKRVDEWVDRLLNDPAPADAGPIQD